MFIVLKIFPSKLRASIYLCSFIDVWQVNLRALQCLPKILPCLANQSGALVPPVVAALTSNFASKNANIFSTAEEALDELIKYIGISFTVVIGPYTGKLMLFVPRTINVQVKLPYAQIT